MSTHLLLLDAGNTRLKWAVLDCTQPQSGDAVAISESSCWLGQGAASYDELASLPALWQQWGGLATCVGVSVASKAIISVVEHHLTQLGLKATWLATTTHAGGVRNGYLPPESLGADRWAALLAARQRTNESALVVSAGTALTIDALDATGHFLGGMILPGLQMMRQALAHTTAQVGMQNGKVQTFPTTTADAVETGLITACTGAIATLRAHLETNSANPPQVFLTGGDGASLRFFLPTGVTMVPGLVLEGVYYLSVEGRLL